MGDLLATLSKLGAITPVTCEAMRKAVGFRNVAVHNYDAINWEIVFAICQKSLPDFRRYVEEVTNHTAR